MLVDFFRVSVLFEESSKHSMTSKPKYFGRQPGFASTSTLTVTRMATKAFRRLFTARASTRVDLRTK